MRIVIEIGDAPVPAQSMHEPRIDRPEGVDQALRDLATVGVPERASGVRIVVETADGLSGRPRLMQK